MQLKNKLLFLFVVFTSLQTFAAVTSTTQEVPKGIKLTKGSIAQLESYQKQQGKDSNKPFKIEMLCYKTTKNKSVLGSKMKCKLERVKFVESLKH